MSSKAQDHYKLALSHIQASGRAPMDDHEQRVELLLGAVAHALLFVGCVEATRPADAPLTKTDGSLRKTLRGE